MRLITAIIVLVLTALLPLRQTSAQDGAIGGAIIGGGLGAIVGGAATGKAGGAVAGGIIGAAAGAMLGSQLEPRRIGYYWYEGRCWRRWQDGSYRLVSRRYCF